MSGKWGISHGRPGMRPIPGDVKAKPTSAQTAPKLQQMPALVAKAAPKPAKVALSKAQDRLVTEALRRRREAVSRAPVNRTASGVPAPGKFPARQGDARDNGARGPNCATFAHGVHSTRLAVLNSCPSGSQRGIWIRAGRSRSDCSPAGSHGLPPGRRPTPRTCPASPAHRASFRRER